VNKFTLWKSHLPVKGKTGIRSAGKCFFIINVAAQRAAELEFL